MPVLGKVQLKTNLDADINTNGVQAITGAVMNSFLTDLMDSVPNLVDDTELLEFKEYQATKVYDIGTATIFEGILYQAQQNGITGAFDRTKWEVIGGQNVGWQDSIIDKLATPPSLGNQGDRYLINNGATGVWAGKDGQIAEDRVSEWRFTEPDDGWSVKADDEDTGFYHHEGGHTVGQFDWVFKLWGALGGIYAGSGSLTGVTTVSMGVSSLKFVSTGSNLLILDAVNDRIGINIAIPASLLHVQSKGAGTSPLLVVTGASNSILRVNDIGGTGGVVLMQEADQTVIQLNTNGTTYFNGGQVAVGTETAVGATKLTVKGSDVTSSTFAAQFLNAASSPLFIVRNDGHIGIGILPNTGSLVLIQKTTTTETLLNGLNVGVINSNAGVAVAIGALVIAESTGSTPFAKGGEFQAIVNSASAVVAKGWIAVETQLKTGTGQAGAILEGISYRVCSPSHDTATRAASMYGVLIENHGSAANTNVYGIKIEDQAAGVNVFPIHQSGTNGTNIFNAPSKFAEVGFYGTTPVSQSSAYTPANVTPTRTYDADSYIPDEIADTLGTLIADLQATGLIG